MPLVNGQEAIAGGVEGQITGGSVGGQTRWGEDVGQSTVNYQGYEGQVSDNDVDGQEADNRPYSEIFPERNTDYNPFPSSGQAPQTAGPPVVRRTAGSVKR